MFNISGQNVNFVQGGPKKTGKLSGTPYLHTF